MSLTHILATCVSMYVCIPAIYNTYLNIFYSYNLHLTHILYLTHCSNDKEAAKVLSLRGHALNEHMKALHQKVCRERALYGFIV